MRKWEEEQQSEGEDDADKVSVRCDLGKCKSSEGRAAPERRRSKAAP